MLLPRWCLPRRAAALEVVVAALLAREGGLGYRRIAARVGRSVWAVRAWLRRARGGHPGWLRQRGVDRAAAVTERPAATAVGAALSALGAAVLAYRRRVRHADVWALIGVFTVGRLLAAP